MRVTLLLFITILMMACESTPKRNVAAEDKSVRATVGPAFWFDVYRLKPYNCQFVGVATVDGKKAEKAYSRVVMAESEKEAFKFALNIFSPQYVPGTDRIPTVVYIDDAYQSRSDEHRSLELQNLKCDLQTSPEYR